MSKFLKYLSIVVLTFVLSNSYAQEYVDDAQFWLNLNLEKKLTDNFDVHFSHSSRINNNISQYGLGYANFGFTYYHQKNIRISADYAIRKRRNLDGSYSDRHRLWLAFVLKKEIGLFTFLYRNQVQSQLEDVYVSEEGKVPVSYDRNKLTVKYRINKRFTGFVSEELFLPFYQAKFKRLDQSRTILGLTLKLSKKADIDFSFIYRHELNAFSPTRRDFIYAISYSYEF